MLETKYGSIGNIAGHYSILFFYVRNYSMLETKYGSIGNIAAANFKALRKYLWLRYITKKEMT